jgi:hypothetical protein
MVGLSHCVQDPAGPYGDPLEIRIGIRDRMIKNHRPHLAGPEGAYEWFGIPLLQALGVREKEWIQQSGTLP